MPSLTACNRSVRSPLRFLSGIGTGCLLLCTAFFIMFGALPAFAHKVSIFAYAENGTIFTESYFPDGKPVVDGRIEVYNNAGRLIQEGRTDKEGNFKFKIKAVEDLTIVLNASMGHRAEFSLKSDELASGNAAGENEKAVQDVKPTEPTETETREADVRLVSGNLTAEDIRKIVREELTGQIEPIRRGIIDLEKREKVSARDIFSGIGYILGLMGIALLVHTRRQKKALKQDE